MMLSDRTVAEWLERRYRGARMFQSFQRRLGPNDVVYLSAWCWGADGKMVEVKASAMSFVDAFVQLLRNADQATTPEEP
jgi:hypothetical protein